MIASNLTWVVAERKLHKICVLSLCILKMLVWCLCVCKNILYVIWHVVYKCMIRRDEVVMDTCDTVCNLLVVALATGCIMSPFLRHTPQNQQSHLRFCCESMGSCMAQRELWKASSRNLSFSLCCQKGSWVLNYMVYSLVGASSNTFQWVSCHMYLHKLYTLVLYVP